MTSLRWAIDAAADAIEAAVVGVRLEAEPANRLGGGDDSHVPDAHGDLRRGVECRRDLPDVICDCVEGRVAVEILRARSEPDLRSTSGFNRPGTKCDHRSRRRRTASSCL